MTTFPRTTVIFDLGGVLIRWNPRFLYSKLIADEAEMEAFLADVCTSDWNECQDAGRTFEEGARELIARHPDKEALIRAFGDRFQEMIPGALEDTAEVLADLKARGTPLYALTNWSSETFPPQRERFPFLALFDGIVVSGDEGLIKPDARLFQRLLERYGVAAEEAVFIDDDPGNARAAAALGIHGIHFQGADDLRVRLRDLGLL
jgi:2-haloacid dehalogenase